MSEATKTVLHGETIVRTAEGVYFYGAPIGVLMWTTLARSCWASAGNAATYADGVQRATGLPVSDFLSMIAFHTGGLQRTFREQSRDALSGQPGWAH